MEILKENLKENYNKNIKEFEEIEKKIKKTIEEKRKITEKLEKNTTLFLNKEIQEEAFLQNETKIKIDKERNISKIQVLEIQKRIILNNLYSLINFDFKKIIYNNIYLKYTSKNIGEKTKEKIQNEVKNYFKTNYNLNIYFYFNKNYNYNGYLNDIDFKIYLMDEKKEYNNRILEYSTCLYMDGSTPYHIGDLFKVTHNLENAHFIYNYDENIIYNIIDNTEKEAKRIFTTSKKLNEKASKLLEEFEKMKKENNNLFKNNLYDFENLYINSYIKKY